MTNFILCYGKLNNPKFKKMMKAELIEKEEIFNYKFLDAPKTTGYQSGRPERQRSGPPFCVPT